MQFFYDLWIDEEDFEDNFHLVEKNSIGEFYEEVLAKDAINLDKIKQKNNLVYFKSLRKKKQFQEMIKGNLQVFKSLIESKKSDITQIISEYNYCISSFKTKTLSDFSLIRENQFSQELEFIMFYGKPRPGMDPTSSLSKLPDDSSVSKDLVKSFPFSKFEHMFGIPIAILSQHDKLFFILNIFLTFLNMRDDNTDATILNNGAEEAEKEGRRNMEKSILEGEVNLSIYEQFFRRIFPGVYYKNPFTFSLVTLSGYFPIGVKVSSISIYILINLRCLCIAFSSTNTMDCS
jgi:hypothetical protein